METVFWIVLAAMLALLVYTVVWASLGIHKKTQPAVDSFFDALHTLLSIKSTPPARGSEVPQQESRPAGAADAKPKN